MSLKKFVVVPVRLVRGTGGWVIAKESSSAINGIVPGIYSIHETRYCGVTAWYLFSTNAGKLQKTPVMKSWRITEKNYLKLLGTGIIEMPESFSKLLDILDVL